MTPQAFVEMVAPHMPIMDIAAVSITIDEYGHPVDGITIDGSIELSVTDAARLLLGAIVDESDYFSSQCGQLTMIALDEDSPCRSEHLNAGCDIFDHLYAALSARASAKGAKA